MVAEFQSLLPTNKTAWEGVIEQTSGERWVGVDADIIRRAFDPWTCPEHLLPFLAYQRSVEPWDNDWTATKKRSAIARAPRLHQIKGTEAAIREAVVFMGGQVLKVIVPPQTLFASPKLTEDERRVFLARYPQLRIYPRRSRATAPAGMFFASASFAGDDFAYRSDALLRVTPRVFIWDNGAETETTTVERLRIEETIQAEQTIQVRRKTIAPDLKLFAGATYAGEAYPLASNARERIYTVRTRRALTVAGQEQLSLRVAPPTLDMIDVRSELVFERFSPARGFFAGVARTGGFVKSSTAGDRVFHRLYMLDPSRNPTSARGKAIFFAGVSRIGMPAYNAEFKIRIRERRPLNAFHAGHNLDGRYLVKSEKRTLTNVLSAVRTHKRVVEKHLVTIKTIAPVTARAGLLAGAVTAGQIVENI